MIKSNTPLSEMTYFTTLSVWSDLSIVEPRSTHVKLACLAVLGMEFSELMFLSQLSLRPNGPLVDPYVVHTHRCDFLGP